MTELSNHIYASFYCSWYSSLECGQFAWFFFYYFGRTYVLGAPDRGRRRTVPPRYHPLLWNQYDAILTNQSKTNNSSEGWHNRFRLLVGKNHPNIFSAVKEFKKEQGGTEIQLVELSLDRKIKTAQKKNGWIFKEDWKRLSNRMTFILKQSIGKNIFKNIFPGNVFFTYLFVYPGNCSF